MYSTHILIPAHESSKEFPYKNSELLKYTIGVIPKRVLSRVHIITDDNIIIEYCNNEGIKYTELPTKYAENASISSTVNYFININSFDRNDTVVVLPLTCTGRTWKSVLNALSYLKEMDASSLLCSKELVGTHPYQCMYMTKNGRGEPVIKHNKLKEIDYPYVFELSHCVCIFKVRELKSLNYNMYNDKTVFFPITEMFAIEPSDVIDEKIDADAYSAVAAMQFTGDRKVIILGNDKSLSGINAGMIPNDFETIGINRAWLHIRTDYVFFNDMTILIELIRSGKSESELRQMQPIASDWLIETAKRNNQFHILKPYIRKNIVRVYDRVDKQKFPDANTTAIEIFNKYIYQSDSINYFLYATSLKYDDKKNHFWSNEYAVIIQYDKTWYDDKFRLALNNFQVLKQQNCKIYSSSSDSLLNDMFTYVPFDMLNTVKLKKADVVVPIVNTPVPEPEMVASNNAMTSISKNGKQRVFIIGGGPSLIGFDFSLIQNEDVIAVNKAIEFVPHATHFITMDYTFISSHYKLTNNDFNIIKNKSDNNYFVVNTQHSYIKNIDGVYTDTRFNLKYKELDKFDNVITSNRICDEKTGFGTAIDKFTHGNNSGYCALQLAILLGYREIYLLGYDLNTNSGRTHFHTGYKQDANRFSKDLAEYRDAFVKSIRLSNMQDRIFSCSPTSYLNKFIKYVDISKINMSAKTSLDDLIVVGYYTVNTPYEQEAHGLINSCKKLKLNSDIVGIPSFGNWQSNTRFKARFMVDMLKKYPGKKLLYIDCDAVIHTLPTLFANYEYDIAVRYQDFRWRQNECLSGTIFIRSNDRTIKLCERWIEINEAEGPNAKTMEQWNLDKAIQEGKKDYGLTFQNLPPEYTFIFDSMKVMYPNVKPIIEHFQASRRFRNKV